MIKKISEVFVLLDDRPGSFSNLTRILKKKNVAIFAIGLFIDTARLHVSDPEQALSILHENGYQVEIREVLRVELPNRLGAMMELTQKIANAGINIHYLYGALAEKDKKGVVIMEVDKMQLTLDIFKTHQF